MTTHNTNFSTKEEYLAFRKAWATAVNNGEEISAAHHVLYNILRGHPHSRGFTPITNANKLRNGTFINAGLYHALYVLRQFQKSGRVPESWLKPFGGTITDRMILDLGLPEEKILWTNYGTSQYVAESIIEGEFKPTNFTQLYEALETYA